MNLKLLNKKKIIFLEYLKYFKNFFLGNANEKYKYTIFLFIVTNFILSYIVSYFIIGWIILIEFIFILVTSLQCYPLLAGGIIILQSVFIGLVNIKNLENIFFEHQKIIFFAIFMMSSIKFLKKILLLIFTKILLCVNSKIYLSLSYFMISAFFSAFLDALTVIMIIIVVTEEFYQVYLNKMDVLQNQYKCDLENKNKKTIKQFRAFLRNLVMQAAIGSTLGGSVTRIGEPQNMLISEVMHWSFFDFFIKMAPINFPVIIFSILTLIILEKYKLCGYGFTLPKEVKNFFIIHNKEMFNNNKIKYTVNLIIQFIILIWLILLTVFQVSDMSLIGISIIILTSSFCGINKEKNIGKNFAGSMSFIVLLIVFFAVVLIINEQKLFLPLIKLIMHINNKMQYFLLYFFNGLLSSISDNIFVSSIFIQEAKNMFKDKLINFHDFENLAITINTGTNLPSIATPNGQSSSLFLLTSKLAIMINLSYKRMFLMSLPFTIVISLVGIICLLSYL